MMDIVELLLKAGFDVEKEDKKRRSPLSIACKSNNYLLVSRLLDFKVGITGYIVVNISLIKLLKVKRRKSLFDLLEGDAAKQLKRRLDDELKLVLCLEMFLFCVSLNV